MLVAEIQALQERVRLLRRDPDPPQLADLGYGAHVFADAPWVSARPDAGFQAVTVLAASQVGFTPEVIARANNYDLVLDLVAAGLGVALIPSSAVRSRPSVQARELRESFDLARLEALVKRASDRSPATLELCELIVQRFSKTTKAHA